MPTITIDGRALEFTPGETIIQVAQRAGIEVPHYCYHPGLSIAGNCRICMVEVEKNPRPQIACYVQAQEGMVVKTTSDLAKESRASVMEMLLVNHPLDCPICDQAGECKLQDFAYEFGWPSSRSPVEKTHQRKNVPFGTNVVYDAERCIKCTRCVRFTDEVSRSHELSMGYRGDREEVVMTSRGEFATPYSMNVVDLCPVGALTSRDFRFESRLWFMEFTDSLCTGCARGCNVVIGGRGGRLLRMVPRENQAVNRWWMCDKGRLGYKFVNSPTRCQAAHVRAADGRLTPVALDVALAEAASLLAKAKGGVLLDAGLSLEEMWLLSRLASRLGGTASYASAVEADGDDFLLVNEKGANQRGAEMLGLARAAAAAPAAVLAVERDRNVPAALRDATGAVVALVADLAHVPASAKVVLPLPTWSEKDGLLVNVDGIVQRIRRAAGVGPRDLPQPVALLESLLAELAPETADEAMGRDAIVDAIAALPAFRDVPFPPVRAVPVPPPPRSVAAPLERTR